MPYERHNKILSVLVGLALVAVCYGIYQHARPRVPNEVACTQEAFLCPDGSYVGREGPRCAFRACPAAPFVIGELAHDTSGYRLILAAPENAGLGVSYAMPLSFSNDANAVPLVGRLVQVRGSFTEGASFTVRSIEESGDATLGTVAVGGSVFIHGVRITLEAITEESRCPTDVLCIQAGRVRARVLLKSDTDSETVEIASDARTPTPFDSYQVSLEAVEPSFTSTDTPSAGKYRLTFRVR